MSLGSYCWNINCRRGWSIISTPSEKDFNLFKGNVLTIVLNLKREFTELIREKKS
ncbi:hypothetical protein ES705_06538 [subsurface metagenome]